MRYSVQPRNRKGYGLFSFTKNIGKNIIKNYAVNIARNFLIILNDLQRFV